MKKNILIITLFVICFAVGFGILTDLSGRWAGVFTAPDGSQYPLIYTFKVDGDKLSGTLDVADMTVPLDSGKVSGNNLSFSVTAEGVTYLHKGIYYPEADSIGMDVTFPGNKAHNTLKRPK